jgi:carotenoid cleavage dioxygenase-like enzyme
MGLSWDFGVYARSLITERWASAMPRYFFHINDGKDFRDNDGSVLTDTMAAHAQAVATAGSMLKEKGEASWGGTEWRMTVVDETGHVICDLCFSTHCPE